MARAEPILTSELAAFLESGLVIVVGTRNADLAPNCAFAAGLRVHPGDRRITVFLGTRNAAASIDDLRANGSIAVTVSRPIDYRTYQLKGNALRISAVSEGDRSVVLAYREGLVRQLEAVGWARSLTRRLSVWPCVAVEVELRELFDQTPGPRAGAVLRNP